MLSFLDDSDLARIRRSIFFTAAIAFLVETRGISLNLKSNDFLTFESPEGFSHNHISVILLAAILYLSVRFYNLSRHQKTSADISAAELEAKIKTAANYVEVAKDSAEKISAVRDSVDATLGAIRKLEDHQSNVIDCISEIDNLRQTLSTHSDEERHGVTFVQLKRRIDYAKEGALSALSTFEDTIISGSKTQAVVDQAMAIFTKINARLNGDDLPAEHRRALTSNIEQCSTTIDSHIVAANALNKQAVDRAQSVETILRDLVEGLDSWKTWDGITFTAETLKDAQNQRDKSKFIHTDRHVTNAATYFASLVGLWFCAKGIFGLLCASV